MGFLRKYVFANAGLKLLALAISFLLWATYTAEPYAEVGFQVPLEFTTMPTQLEMSGDVPTVVHVRVRGRSALLAPHGCRRSEPAPGHEGREGRNHDPRFHARNGGRPVWRHCRASCPHGNPRYSCATPRPGSSRRMTRSRARLENPRVKWNAPASMISRSSRARTRIQDD